MRIFGNFLNFEGLKLYFYKFYRPYHVEKPVPYEVKVPVAVPVPSKIYNQPLNIFKKIEYDWPYSTNIFFSLLVEREVPYAVHKEVKYPVHIPVAVPKPVCRRLFNWSLKFIFELTDNWFFSQIVLEKHIPVVHEKHVPYKIEYPVKVEHHHEPHHDVHHHYSSEGHSYESLSDGYHH